MEQQMIAKARDLVNRNVISSVLSTVDREYNVNSAIITVMEMIDDETIICARFGADLTYANLKSTGKGVFLILLTDGDQTKDGIRIYVELTGDYTSGPYFERVEKRLKKTRYGQFALRNCLVFKITGLAPISTLKR